MQPNGEFGVYTGFLPTALHLPAGTRTLAARYLSGAVGREVREAAFAISSEFYLSLPTNNQIAAEAVRLIAEFAPLRLFPEEHLVGAATLAEAMCHRIPLAGFGSVSHTTLGFDRAVTLGLGVLRTELAARLAEPSLDVDTLDELQAMRVCLEAMGVWHQRYLEALESLYAVATGDARSHLAAVLAAFAPVPEAPPSTFHQALQSVWFLWDFQRLCGNWSGIGRIDQLLGPYLDADLRAGRLTLDKARDLLAHFWIKGCEWITAEGRGSGDAQFYQNIVLGGIDADGHEVTNAVTYLVLDVVEELHISDFPIAVRISRRTPETLLRRIAEVQRLGGGIVAIYNEDDIIDNLVTFGYPLEEARDFANDGCWEVIIPGKTHFGYQPFDLLRLLQETLGLAGDGVLPDYPDFTALYQDFRARMARQLTAMVNTSGFSNLPSPLVDLLVEGCLARGRGYFSGGPWYIVSSPHAGGLPDVADSLLVIRKLVYEQGRLTLPALLAMVREDWHGHESLRRAIRAQIIFYGNDDSDADAMVQQVFNDFTGLVGQVHDRYGILRPAGISTFGREGSDFLSFRCATAAGQHTGDILSPNFSPAPGADQHGPTAVIRSHCAVDFHRLPCGTALDIKICPASLHGEEGIMALVGLMRTFVELGGVFLQLDVVDAAVLRDAQQHPDRYPNLSVRVSGWSARFATLTSEWQEMVISRVCN